MIVVKGLLWDDWNREHLKRHNITTKEVEEVCHDKHEEIESYRKRIQLTGRTKKGRKLTLILSPEDRNLKLYEKGIYYPITAFEEVD
ncbi:MAG TPA: hypothetical protein VE090_06270 [Methylomirabilota bacterium]|nr:hypothetical protein [Methylomirabilota bacterium]